LKVERHQMTWSNGSYL